MPSGDGAASAPFVFATAQYESGDWDSAPLVPANVIDSIARYTSLPVRSQGVSVPLASDAVFQYPLLYLTGHLPVRFTTREADVLGKYLARGGLLHLPLLLNALVLHPPFLEATVTCR